MAAGELACTQSRAQETSGDSGIPATAVAALATAPAAAAATDAPVAWPARSACLYAKQYCEENVYWLAKALVDLLPPRWQVWVVFVSNASKSVPLWRQRAADSPVSAVVWDYHVFLLAQLGGQPPLVFDLDSTLPFPCPLPDYQREALLGGDDSLPPRFRRQYRAVPGHLFLRHFSSDRSHMRESGGGWLAPPPPWPCIKAQDGPNTLPAYLDFSQHSGEGAGKQGGGRAAAAAQQQQQQERQERQQERRQAGAGERHGGGGLDADAAALGEDGPPYGVVLPEPAFLQRFGLYA